METHVLDAVEAVGSRLEKERLLATASAETVTFMKWALDPMITFGVTVDHDEQLRRWNRMTFHTTHDNFWSIMNQFCHELSCRIVTGNSALNQMDDLLIAAPSENDLKWACRVINKDLRCGVQVSTLNKVFPGSIEPFACSLAKPYEPDKHDLRGAWCVEPKLDGLRMVVLDGVAYTRNGRVIESVGHILAEIDRFKDEFVFDGEVMGDTKFDEDSGKIRKKGEGPNLSLVYNVFDCVRRDEWFSRKTRPLHERKSDLLSLDIGSKNVKVVDWFDVTANPTAEELFRTRDKLIGLGYEGAMLKDNMSPYVFKRSDAILKLKDFQDADGRIMGCFEGKGRHKGRLGGFIAEFDGVPCRVGSGFSDAQRIDLWAKRSSLDGKMIEVQYQNKTPDGSLRFPVFIRFRPDKE